MMVTVPQLVRLIWPGPTRSSIAAVPELPELRLTPSAWPNAVHTPGVKMPAAVRSTPASPNSLTPSVSLAGATVSATGTSFTFASAKPEAVRGCAGPQQGALSWLMSHAPEVTHFRTVSVATPELLPSKSYTNSRSPAVRCTSPSLLPPQAVLLWLNSNPTWVEALTEFCGILIHARFKKTCPLTV